MFSGSYKFTSAAAVLTQLTIVGTLVGLYACQRPTVKQSKDRDGVVYTPLPPVIAGEGNAGIKSQQPEAIRPNLDDTNTALCQKLYTDPDGLLAVSPRGASLLPEADTELKALLSEVNAARTAAGQNPLQQDPDLNKAARMHASDMLRRGFFSHVSPEGCGLSQRVFLGTNFGAGRVGEVIAYGQKSAADTVSAWLRSPPHRENLLDPRHLRIGMAVGSAEPEQSNEGGFAQGEGLHWVVVVGRRGSDGDSPEAPPSQEKQERERLRRLLGTYMCPQGSALRSIAPNTTGAPMTGSRAGTPMCVTGSEATAAVTADMRALCLKWGGGAATCKTNLWSEKMMISARGTAQCPVGSSLQTNISYCVEGRLALGPFPEDLLKHCEQIKGGNSALTCLRFSMEKSILERLLK
jgi:uncharacterized protein YkwD